MRNIKNYLFAIPTSNTTTRVIAIMITNPNRNV